MSAEPMPFGELLKVATPGPWQEIDGEIWNGDATVFIADADGRNSPFACNRTQRLSNAQLIDRLTAWAHAGGVDALRNSCDLLDAFCVEYWGHQPEADKLRASLALLDGKTP